MYIWVCIFNKQMITETCKSCGHLKICVQASNCGKCEGNHPDEEKPNTTPWRHFLNEIGYDSYAELEPRQINYTKFKTFQEAHAQFYRLENKFGIVTYLPFQTEEYRQNLTTNNWKCLKERDVNNEVEFDTAYAACTEYQVEIMKRAYIAKQLILADALFFNKNVTFNLDYI